jgi:hypothetical protein
MNLNAKSTISENFKPIFLVQSPLYLFISILQDLRTHMKKGNVSRPPILHLRVLELLRTVLSICHENILFTGKNVLQI